MSINMTLERARRIAGALPEGELIAVLGQVGFRSVEIRERFDPFRCTSKERTARKFGVVGVNIFARKPE